jgi:hypothetical protein
MKQASRSGAVKQFARIFSKYNFAGRALLPCALESFT